MWCSFCLEVVIVSFFFCEVCNVLYGKLGVLSHQAGMPEGHLTHWGGDHLYIGDPGGIILYNIPSTHCSHHGFNDHFWLHEPQGYLKGGHRQWVPLQADCYLLKAQGWSHHVCWFQRLGKGESHLASSTCNCSSALWHQALIASELWWWCLCFISPKAGRACPAVATSQRGV